MVKKKEITNKDLLDYMKAMHAEILMNFSEIKNCMKELKSDIAELKRDLHDIRVELSIVKAGIDQIIKGLNIVKPDDFIYESEIQAPKSSHRRTLGRRKWQKKSAF